MKKIKAVKDMFGHELPLDRMDILFIGADYIVAKFKNYGFIRTYGAWDGYTIVYEN